MPYLGGGFKQFWVLGMNTQGQRAKKAGHRRHRPKGLRKKIVTQLSLFSDLPGSTKPDATIYPLAGPIRWI